MSTITFLPNPLGELSSTFRRFGTVEREKRDATMRRRPPEYHKKAAMHDTAASTWFRAADLLEAAMKAEQVEAGQVALS
jgi:hypothetical protein